MEMDEFKKSLERELAERTGRQDIEVTVGPYRSHDVSVSEASDHHPIADFYSAMRWDNYRVRQAVDYAVELIKNWEFVTAEAEAEKKAVKPIFERIRQQFPEAELEYVTGERATHFVQVEKKEGKKPIVTFDLWFGMDEGDIEKLEDEIRMLLDRLGDREMTWGTMGTEYW
jgi:hypothetical protein